MSTSPQPYPHPEQGQNEQPRQGEAQSLAQPESIPQQECPQCGNQMPGIRGAKDAICGVCGYKESCCY